MRWGVSNAVMGPGKVMMYMIHDMGNDGYR